MGEEVDKVTALLAELDLANKRIDRLLGIVEELSRPDVASLEVARWQNPVAPPKKVTSNE